MTEWQADNGDSPCWGVFDKYGQAICYLSDNPARGTSLHSPERAERLARMFAAAPETAAERDQYRELLREMAGALEAALPYFRHIGTEYRQAVSEYQPTYEESVIPATRIDAALAKYRETVAPNRGN